MGGWGWEFKVTLNKILKEVREQTKRKFCSEKTENAKADENQVHWKPNYRAPRRPLRGHCKNPNE